MENSKLNALLSLAALQTFGCQEGSRAVVTEWYPRQPPHRRELGKFEVTIHTFRCPLDCWDSLVAYSHLDLQGSVSACQSTTLTFKATERAFLANQTQPNCYRACYFQGCLDSGVRGRSYQDLKNLVCKHQERKASLVWPCKHPLPLSMFLMSLTPPTLSTRSSIPSISRTSEFWLLSFPSGCSTWYMRTAEGG